jgi:hypothetical protein
MIPRWANLNESDRAIYRAALVFIRGRLDKRATMDWALQLKPSDHIKRAALLDLIDAPAEGNKITEPWRSAWRLIEESWDSPAIENGASMRAVYIPERLKAGDRSGALVAEITKLVTPRVKVEPFSKWQLQVRKLTKTPRSIEQLFSARIASGELVDPNKLGLAAIIDIDFLIELANALDAVVTAGLDIARRIGRDGKRYLWHLGQINRVYFVPEGERPAGEDEPDEFNRGLSPSVKLLHFVVSRIAALNSACAIQFVQRWRQLASPVHIRLWAALARDSRIMQPNEVASFLLSLDDRYFWDQNVNPEVAELRAARFGEFGSEDQSAILIRLRKRPPRSQFPKKVERNRAEKARLYWAVRELRRIETAGAVLPHIDKQWLDAHIGQFPELINMSRIDEGFMGTHKAQWVAPKPDAKYDLLVGEERLKALENALSSARGGWDDDPAERASDWIRQQGNPTKVIGDFESVPNGGAEFFRVWERFGWSHSPAQEQAGEEAPGNLSDATRVLSLLVTLPDPTTRRAIDGITNWLSTWERRVVTLPEWFDVWLRLWPAAVEKTNSKSPVEDQVDLQTVAKPSADSEPMDLDTLNTQAGKLVSVFLASCPRIDHENPFAANGPLKTIRDTIIAAPGRAGLIVKHRLIEWLPYFLRADTEWTQEHLIRPLISENIEALALWRAIARRTQFSKVLQIIGGPMANRATDPRLGRETRRSLVFSFVVECLHALRERRAPAVPFVRVQQMIRSLDDEVRAYGAGALERFIRDLSSSAQGNTAPPSSEELFQTAVRPFLQHIWPQEQSLSTPGVSKALADLPAIAKSAFADAVNSIERFLVPFECWSMLDYGLYGDEDGEPKLSNIDNQEKAAAFLRLLDRTIGTSEGSVIPMDLGNALDQVRKVAPNLVESQTFRRLATAARRV